MHIGLIDGPFGRSPIRRAAPHNERCCSQRHGGALCNYAALRAASFTANLFEPLQQNAALARTVQRVTPIALLTENLPMHDPFTPANVLLQIRDRGATDWVSLRRVLSVHPRDHSSATFLARAVRQLVEAGLLVADQEAWMAGGSLRLSDQWHKLQATLGIRLSWLVALEDESSVLVQPFFGAPHQNDECHALDMFVAMPFSEALRPVYDDHIKAVAHRLGLAAKRANDFFTIHSIVLDVWSAIWNARVVVADCTGRNPNVFYEIGIAHSIGKPVVLIAQSADDVPFDVRHIRYIEYSFTPRGMSEFELRLADTLGAALQHTST